MWPVYEIDMKVYFQINTAMPQIICICMLLITTFLCTQLPSYYLLCALVLSMPISPQTQHLQLLTCVTKSARPMDLFFLMASSFRTLILIKQIQGKHKRVEILLNSPIVCVVLTQDSWNYSSREQGLVAQHIHKIAQFPLYTWTMYIMKWLIEIRYCHCRFLLLSQGVTLPLTQ